MLLIIIFCIHTINAQFSFDSILNKHPLLKQVSASPQKYRLQILYTEIIKKGNERTFITYTLTQNPQYIYCASLVKLPTSILALQKLNDLKIPTNSVMFTDSAIVCHKKIISDTTSQNKLPSIEHYIKKMLLVSDNEAFGRVYEFLGVDYLHKELPKLGMPNTRIINRYDGGCGGSDNLNTNPVRFFNNQNQLIFSQANQKSNSTYTHPLGSVKVGKAYYNSKNKLINQPKDFSFMNHLPLNEIHQLLIELIYNPNKKVNLTTEQRNFLIQQMTLYPSQSNYPKYNQKTYYDSYKKYFFYGDSKKPITDSSLTITNIVGQSYGFMVDCAYIKDKKNNIEYFLTASIYANEDEIINDGKYEYKTIALPFLAELGKQFHYFLKNHKTK